jgi:NAD(P)-dependent dehydrogenase (short-subunit alcohol dehydrogenase family)
VNVFITGASSGIGAALARHYAAAGANVGLLARRPDALDAVASTLPPARVACYAGDVVDVDVLNAAADDFRARFGATDVVIANAGISRGTLTEMRPDLEVFKRVLDTNVMGMVNTFHPFIEPMRRERKGTLVGIASLAGYRGLPGSGAYSASKAAAIAYCESLRVELAGSGVRVLTVCPGYVATPMTARNPYRMPFLLSPERAAALIVRAIDRGQRFYVLPWQMRWVGRLLRVLPRPLFDAAFARAKRKPREA